MLYLSIIFSDCTTCTSIFLIFHSYNPESASKANPLKTDHEHISWEVNIREILNTDHPVKDMKC